MYQIIHYLNTSYVEAKVTKQIQEKYPAYQIAAIQSVFSKKYKSQYYIVQLRKGLSLDKMLYMLVDAQGQILKQNVLKNLLNRAFKDVSNFEDFELENSSIAIIPHLYQTDPTWFCEFQDATQDEVPNKVQKNFETSFKTKAVAWAKAISAKNPHQNLYVSYAKIGQEDKSLFYNKQGEQVLSLAIYEMHQKLPAEVQAIQKKIENQYTRYQISYVTVMHSDAYSTKLFVLGLAQKGGAMQYVILDELGNISGENLVEGLAEKVFGG